MNRLPARDFEFDLSWSALALESPPATPSWLAPPLESSTFPVARAVMPAAEVAPIHSAPPLRIVPSPAAGPSESDSPAEPPYPDLRDENATLIARLERATAAVGQIRRGILEASEGEMVRLACAVAERIARRELTVDPTIVLGWVREASEALAASDSLTLVVSPDLAATVDEVALRKSVSSTATLEIDASLGPMRCEIRTRVARVDASLEARLAAVAEELGVPRE
jgi:hypothetical protein